MITNRNIAGLVPGLVLATVFVKRIGDRILASMLLLLSAVSLASAREYALQGRVVDETGKPAANAIVVVDIIPQKECLNCVDHLSAFVEVQPAGDFTASIDAKKGDTARIWTISPAAETQRSLILPPFYAVALPTRYHGLDFPLGNRRKIYVGDVRVRLEYRPVRLDFVESAFAPMFKEKLLWVRLVTSEGLVAAETSVRQSAFSTDHYSVGFSLPADTWKIEFLDAHGGRVVSEPVVLDLINNRSEHKTVQSKSHP